MIKIKTKKGKYIYEDWEYNLAWALVFVFGVIVGYFLK